MWLCVYSYCHEQNSLAVFEILTFVRQEWRKKYCDVLERQSPNEEEVCDRGVHKVSEAAVCFLFPTNSQHEFLLNMKLKAPSISLNTSFG